MNTPAGPSAACPWSRATWPSKKNPETFARKKGGPLLNQNLTILLRLSPSRLSPLAVWSLCDQRKSCLERNVSLHRSGYLYQKIIPSRENKKLPDAVSHRRYSGHVHCPQPETCVPLPFVKLQKRLHDFIDVPSEGGFYSNPELHKHVS